MPGTEPFFYYQVPEHEARAVSFIMAVNQLNLLFPGVSIFASDNTRRLSMTHYMLYILDPHTTHDLEKSEEYAQIAQTKTIVLVHMEAHRPKQFAPVDKQIITLAGDYGAVLFDPEQNSINYESSLGHWSGQRFFILQSSASDTES